jgi:hypothetical protein
MIESLISFGLFAVLLALNKKLMSLKVFVIVVLFFLALIGLLLFVLNMNFKPFVVPFAYLIIFQPIVRYFSKRYNREPILYIRGVQLTPQEEHDISIEDYIYTTISIVIPIAMFFVVHLSIK